MPKRPPATQVTVTPVLPRGPSVSFGLVGSAKLGPVSGGGSGGLQIVDRPLQKAIVQWYDASPLEVTMDLILDGGTTQLSVEPQCAQVVSWYYPKSGAQNPPVLALNGPISTQAKTLYWQLHTFAFDDDKAIRNPHSGARTQATLTLGFYEYVPATASVLTNLSPAKAAQEAMTAKGYAATRRTYVVHQGDTLKTIAARQLGDASQWTVLATLNGIRDPRAVHAGQRILLP